MSGRKRKFGEREEGNEKGGGGGGGKGYRRAVKVDSELKKIHIQSDEGIKGRSNRRSRLREWYAQEVGWGPPRRNAGGDSKGESKDENEEKKKKKDKSVRPSKLKRGKIF